MAIEDSSTTTQATTASHVTPTKWESWSASLVLLQSYQKQHGHANPSEGRLADWLDYQRALYGKGIHSPLHVEILRDMGCWGFEGGGPEPKSTADGSVGDKSGTESAVGHVQSNVGKAIPVMVRDSPVQLRPKEAAAKSLPDDAAAQGTAPKEQKQDDSNRKTIAFDDQPQEKESTDPIRGLVKPKFASSSSSSKESVAPETNEISMSTTSSNGMEEQEAKEAKKSWKYHLNALKLFNRLFGHANPRWHERGEGAVNDLAVWLGRQREAFARGFGLSTENAQTLHDLGCTGFCRESEEKKVQEPASGILNHYETRLVVWFVRFMELYAWKNRSGHPNITKEVVKSLEEKRLLVWLEGQRAMFRKGTHGSSEQVRMLEDLGCTAFGELPDKQAGKREPILAFACDKSDGMTSTVNAIESFGSPTGICPPSVISQETVQTTPISYQLPSPSNVHESKNQATSPPRFYFQEMVDFEEFSASEGYGEIGSDIPQLNDNDVVCWGECTPAYNIVVNFLPGNVQLREIVKLQGKYVSMLSSENVHIAEGIVLQVHSMTPRGRFVVKNGVNGLWMEVEYQDAINFVLQTLREETAGIEYDDESMDYMDDSDDIPSPSYDCCQASDRFGLASNHKKEAPKQGSKHWEARFQSLVEYKFRNGHANPKKSKKTGEVDMKVGTWLSDQRRSYRNGRLSYERTQRLHNLGCTGFDETSATQKAGRKPVHILMADYDQIQQELGHTLVSTPPSLEPASSYEKDMARQRAAFFWLEQTKTGNRSNTWKDNFFALKDFTERRQGAMPSEEADEPDEEMLATWLERQNHKFNREKLCPEQITLLQYLGCAGFEVDPDDWSDRSVGATSDQYGTPKFIRYGGSTIEKKAGTGIGRLSFEERVSQLVDYKWRYGHSNPSKSKGSSEHDNKLGRWLQDQRQSFQDGRLPPERARQLHDIGCEGFMSNAIEDKWSQDDVPEDSDSELEVNEPEDEVVQAPNRQWEAKFLSLVQFKNENRHARPRRSRDATDAEFKLGGWLTSQRMKYRDGKLDEDRTKRLRELGCEGFGEDKRPEEPIQRLTSWEQHYNNLRTYKQQHGHANPRRAKGAAFELGNWLVGQRHRFRKDQLVPEKVALLRKLGCAGFDDGEEVASSITEPGAHDVVCGRGGHSNSWPGNIEFRRLVNSQKEIYHKQKKHQKLAVAMDIVARIRNMNPAGRFLMKDSNGLWVEIADKQASRKTSQALREATPYLVNPHKEDNDESSGNGNDSDENSERSVRDQESDGGSGGDDEESESGDEDSADDSDDDQGSLEDMSDILALETKVTSGMPWSARYFQLRAFKKREGHAHPGCAQGPNYQLGHWLSDQRYRYKKGTLQEVKTKRLRALGCKGFGLEEDTSGESMRQEPQRKSKQRPARKRRLGMVDGDDVTNPAPVLTTTRSGRASKLKKNSESGGYFFY